MEARCYYCLHWPEIYFWCLEWIQQSCKGLCTLRLIRINSAVEQVTGVTERSIGHKNRLFCYFSLTNRQLSLSFDFVLFWRSNMWAEIKMYNCALKMFIIEVFPKKILNDFPKIGWHLGFSTLFKGFIHPKLTCSTVMKHNSVFIVVF